jgi:hypothetical protein
VPGEAGRGLHLERNAADRVRRDLHAVRHDLDSDRVRGAAGLYLEVSRYRDAGASFNVACSYTPSR